jgi:hypothetical protein
MPHSRVTGSAARKTSSRSLALRLLSGLLPIDGPLAGRLDRLSSTCEPESVPQLSGWDGPQPGQFYFDTAFGQAGDVDATLRSQPGPG